MTSVFIVHTNPVPGREEEFNTWYTERHLVDVVAIPGFVRARRYRLSKSQTTPLPGFEYAAIYEIDGDPAVALAGLRSAIAAGMDISTAMEPQPYATVYEPITDWVSG